MYFPKDSTKFVFGMHVNIKKKVVLLNGLFIETTIIIGIVNYMIYGELFLEQANLLSYARGIRVKYLAYDSNEECN